ncbi:hypothetical protein NPIL_473971 [Nephila pilipes]|uniref:Uncharacterized protein n=1 Tax=Nephila pilipes TaxID=299642 RepID=A0A8X6TJN2_NEPPI|nr:hypothetical protein NPIL_473971 [Nephila pilipes]
MRTSYSSIVLSVYVLPMPKTIRKRSNLNNKFSSLCPDEDLSPSSSSNSEKDPVLCNTFIELTPLLINKVIKNSIGTVDYSQNVSRRFVP